MEKLILLTGATGYVGGRLLTRLQSSGYKVRCFSRHPEFQRAQRSENTEVVKGDVQDYASLEKAMQGVDIAYYLIHSMGSQAGFVEQDRVAATNFAKAAKAAGVSRVIYLGGLGHQDDLSSHLASRQEVGRILVDCGPTTIEFRASIIVGSGSLSFELLRALVNKLPLLITPKWLRSRAQPIFIEDVLEYLLQALDVEVEGSQVFEIGGPDRVTYEGLLKLYSKKIGVRRIFLPVSVLSPYLSSLWLGLVTPVYARVGRKLIDSLVNDTIVTCDKSKEYFSVKPIGAEESVERALRNEDREFAFTRWSDSISSACEEVSWGGRRFGSRIVDTERTFVKLNPSEAFRPIISIGGESGWYYANALWRIRGFIDLLVGGVGLRRGRRDPNNLVVGDALDFWRVEAVERDSLLRLRAEMKVPGRAWLQYELKPADEGTEVVQTAIFDPLGLSGLAYWYALYPLHRIIFAGMIRSIAKRAYVLKENKNLTLV